MEYMEFDPDSNKVVIEIGGVAVDREKLSEKLSTDYDFLVDGKDASGGGASGGAGDQGSFKPLKEYSEEEARKLYAQNPAFRKYVSQTKGG
jgi:hypothetical protein